MTIWRWCIWPLLICVSSAAMADSVYRWRDETGVLHFSGVPPAGIAAEPVRLGRISVVSITPAVVPTVSDCMLPDSAGAEDAVRDAQGAPCEALPNAEPEPQAAEPSPVVGTPERHRSRDTLSSRSERLRDYDRSERIDEIKSRREATRGYARSKPKTVTQQLRERAQSRSP